jgi:DivIVA domain-containing protein
MEDLTAAEVRTARFSGTRYVYDRREVDAYLTQVADALDRYEDEMAATSRRLSSLEQALELARERAEAGPAPAGDVAAEALADLERRAEQLRIDALAEAATIRRRAEEEAARVTEQHPVPVAAPSPPPSDEGGAWRRLLAERDAAAELLAAATEEARRATQIAEATTAEHRSAVESEREASAEALDAEMASRREDALRESAALLEDARRGGERIIEEARRSADQLSHAAHREVRALERRVRQVRSSLRDLEGRFRQLTSSTLAEFSMLGDLIDLDVRSVDEVADDASPSASAADATEGRSERGFYERRLAGLRSRIEANTDDEA